MSDIAGMNTEWAGTVYYDADCAFCVWVKGLCEGVLSRRGIVFRPSAEGILEDRQPFPASEYHDELKLVNAAGDWYGGADAVLYLMKLVPWLRPLAWLGSTAILRPVVAFCYRFIARRRSCMK